MKRCNKKLWVWLPLLLLLVGAVVAPMQLESDELNKNKTETEPKNMAATAVPYDIPLPEDYSGTITSWGWDEGYFNRMAAAFQQHYPNVKFEFTKIPNKNLVECYETELIMGGELPDIAWAIVDTRGEVFALDLWEHLEEAPYNLRLSEIMDYMHPRLVDSDGHICAVEQSLSPAGLAYRRDLAKAYLGTDDPDELSALLPDWEAFIEQGKEVYEKSGGQVFMCPSLGDMRQFMQEQVTLPWADGKTIDVQAVFGRTMNLICRFRDEHIADDLIAWTDDWYKALGEGRHIFIPCASWSVGAIRHGDSEGESLGRWGLMEAPEGNVNMGGTAMGITKTCKDKRLAWEFLKFATLSTEGAQVLHSTGLMTAAKQPYLEDPSLKSYKSSWFGTQNIGAYYLDRIVPNIKVRPLTPQDGIIFDRIGLLTNVLIADRSMTAEEALDTLRMELRGLFPGFSIE